MDQGGIPVAHRKPLVVAAAVAALAVAALAPAPADARPVGRGRGHVGVVIGGYYDPFFFNPFVGPLGWGYGWSPYAYGAYGYRPYGAYGYEYGYGPYGRPYEETSSARIQVTPKEAEVYVDGYRAGRVDDFDGTFQRLHVAPGPHELTLFLPGYRTITEKVYVGEGSTIKVRETMARLAPGETSERPPAPPARTAPRRRSRDGRADGSGDSRDDLAFDSRTEH
jgi:PEGA domain-containing protein